MMNQMPFDALIVSPLGQINLVGFAGIIVWRLIPSRRSKLTRALWSRSRSLLS